MSRPHPLYLYYDTKKWMLILLLPILRALFSQQDGISVLLSSLGDIALAAALIGYSVLKWRRATYSLHGGLTFRYGLIYRRMLRVTAEDTASVEVECSPLMWLTRGRRIRMNTAGLRRRSDATIFLPAAAARVYMGADDSQPVRRYAGQVLPVLIMSASSSNAAVGLLTLAPAIKETGQLLGREVTGEVYGLVGRLITFGLPPLLDTAAHILFLGWCFAFVFTFAKTAGFYTERCGKQLHLVSGLITRRDTYIDCRRITALELRQTLFMRFFDLHTVTIAAAGYGRERGRRPIILPAARPRELCRALDILLPEYPTCACSLRPVKSALLGYTLPPLLLTAGSILPLLLGSVRNTPAWDMLAVVWFIAGAWWLSVRLAAYSRAGLGVSGRAVTMRYCRGLALYEIHVPREVADCAKITRSPWQMRNGTCTVELRCFGEKQRRHRVTAMPYEASRELLRQLLDTHTV